MLKNKSLSFKLNTYILLVISVIAVFIFTAYSLISKEIRLKNVQENAKNLTYNNSNKIEKILKSVEKITESIAVVLEQTSVTDSELDSLIKTIVKNNNEISGCAAAFEPFKYSSSLQKHAPYYFKDGLQITKTNLADESLEYFYYDWYQIPKLLNHSIWNEPYFDEGGNGKLKSSFSVPFYKGEHTSKNMTGIVTVNISLDWLQDIIGHIKIYETGYAFLVSNRGTFITNPNKNMILNESIFSVAEEKEQQELRTIGRKMIKGGDGFVFVPQFIDKEDCWISFAPLRSISWSVAVVIPQEELYASLSYLNRIISLIGLVGIIILFVTIMFISRSMTLPLRAVTNIAGEISKGNISAAVSELKQIEVNNKEVQKLIHDSDEKSKDEISLLFSAVSKMTYDLNKLLDRVVESVENVTLLKNKIVTSIRQLEATVTEQAASTNEVNATTNQISATVKSLANTMGDVSKVSLNAAESTTNGLQNVAEIQNTMGNLNDSVNKISEKLKNIDSKAGNISNIISTITKIADKTNLLALNTAIESEKAGIYGAGFTVIAQEIRRLADQTAIATLDIESIVDEMQESVKEGVFTVEKHTEETIKSSDKINRLSVSLTKIIEQSKNLTPQFEFVNQGMQQQSEGAFQISEAMGQLNIVAKQTKGSLIELNDITIDLNKAINELHKEVGKFTV